MGYHFYIKNHSIHLNIHDLKILQMVPLLQIQNNYQNTYKIFNKIKKKNIIKLKNKNKPRY